MFFELDINQIKHNTKTFWSLYTVFPIKWLIRKKRSICKNQTTYPVHRIQIRITIVESSKLHQQAA